MIKALDFLSFPDILKRSPLWVNFRFVERDGKTTKVPYQPNGQPAESNNADTWSEFDRVIAACNTKLKFDGIGCMISPPYCAVDFDHVRNKETGEIEKWALDALTRLNTYTEVSPSGTGLHAWLYTDKPLPLPPGDKRGGKKVGRIEIYSNWRYFTVTAKRLPEFPASVNELPTDFFTSVDTMDPQREKSKPKQDPPSRMTRSQRFALLLLGKWKECGYSSQSEADLAFCVMLAQDFKGDRELIDASFRKSGLYRPKWDERHGPDTYGNNTISKALTHFKAEAIAELDDDDAEDTEDEIIEWLWPGKLALGKLCILTGEMDMMKSTISDDIAARIRLQLPWPDGAQNILPPSGTLICAAEEDYADTRKPRLRAAGFKDGDFRGFVRFVKGIRVQEGDSTHTRELALREDSQRIARRLEQYPNIKLVVFDPLSSYFGSKTDENSNKSVREVLKPLTDMLQDRRVAGFGIAHFGKNITVKAAQKTLGSTAIMAVARTGWGCVKAEDGNKEHRLMLCVKGNILKKRVGMLYESESINVSWTSKLGVTTTTEMWRVKWLSESEKNIDDVLDDAKDPDAPKGKRAIVWLKDHLSDGRKQVKMIFGAGKSAGSYTEDMLERAAKLLKVKRTHQGKIYYWELENEQSQEEGTLF